MLRTFDAVLSALNSSLLILRQDPRMAGAARPLSADSILMSASGDKRSLLSANKAAADENLFDPGKPNALAMKIDLMKRTGEAFGFDRDDFSSPLAYATAISSAFSKLQPAAVAAIETELGLDRLGISLRDVIDAMVDPASDANSRLDAALRQEAGETADDGDGSATHIATETLARLDEIGRYGQ